tara:strand:- start:320 stop:616 length:297 start_codon:yes stop_codon:yes gene_type:complete
MITAIDNDSRMDTNIITVFGYVICIFKSTVWIEYKLTGEYLINQFDEYLIQGVIVIRKILGSRGVLRSFTLEKMSDINHHTQPHPYKIGNPGIEVYPS